MGGAVWARDYTAFVILDLTTRHLFRSVLSRGGKVLSLGIGRHFDSPGRARPALTHAHIAHHNPLSSRSVIESCILPVLLYGSETWVLNSSLLNLLESFQAELGRRILKLPKFASNTVPLLVPSMCARLLCNKLSFLFRVCNGGSTSLSTQVFRTIAVSDVTSMSIVTSSTQFWAPNSQMKFFRSTLRYR